MPESVPVDEFLQSGETLGGETQPALPFSVDRLPFPSCFINLKESCRVASVIFNQTYTNDLSTLDFNKYSGYCSGSYVAILKSWLCKTKVGHYPASV